MKRLIPILALGLVTLSCSREVAQYPEESLREISLSPRIEMKSSFERGATSVVWSVGDGLSVLDGTANRKFLSSSTSDQAMFKGTVSSDATALAVVYPYRPSVSAGSGNTIKAVLPEIQWAALGKVSDESMLSVGRASVADFSVNMKNVAGFVSISIPSGLEKVTKIDFIANGGEKISGSVTVDYDGNSDPSVVSADGGSCVSLCTPYSSLAAGEYYLSALPSTLSSGFTLVFHRSDGKVASISSSRSNTVRRNKVLDLGLIDASKLVWNSEASSERRTVTISFASWPFDQPGGNVSYPDSDILYVAKTKGYSFLLGGSAYYESGQIVFPASCSGFTLPALAGCRLVEVTGTASGEVPAFFFSDGDDIPVSGRDSESLSKSWTYKLNGTQPGRTVKMMASSTSSLSSLSLVYETVFTAPEVESVGYYNGISGSFTFSNGTDSDFVYGISYIPSGSDDWSLAEDVIGTRISSTSNSVTFKAVLPSGAVKARPWARPASCDKSANRYGELVYSSSARKTITLDFSTVPFTKYGTSGGEGTFESPRTGVDFPTGKQTVTDQKTGATSNGGSSLYGERSGTTKYWTNYPISKFNYTDEDGKSYQFLFGTAVSLYDAFCYISGGYLYNNKARFSYPGIPGFRIKSITMNIYAAGSYLYSFGRGTSYSNLGSTTSTLNKELCDISINFPASMEPGEGVNTSSNNSFQIKKMTIEYIK